MIPISRPWLDEAELEALRGPLSSGWVAQGPEVEAFEREFAEATGASYACATSSGTTALSLALMALGVTAGDEVITVSHSFIATANVVRQVGAMPVFVDIDPVTFTMDPELVERVITPRTQAILCVHQLGMPCDVTSLRELAARHAVALVEDAACAVGSEILIDERWERIGAPHGDIACFSFHPRKLLTTGEGGMITTSDPEVDAKCRSLRQHGRPSQGGAYSTVGFNFRMSDLHAAVGRVQLRKLDTMLERRSELAARYGELLESIDQANEITAPTQPSWAQTNWQSYCVRLSQNVDRATMISSMKARGVTVLGGVMCAHAEPAYQSEPWSCGLSRSECGCKPGHCDRLARSEEARDRCLLLPIFHEITDDEQVQVVEALRAAIVESHHLNTKR